MVNSITIDLGAVVKVDHFKFLAENDDNHINERKNYELFYWTNNNWKSLGKKIGDNSHLLKYENAPRNALFLLLNLDKGTEHRIFTYENDKQVWL